MKVISIIQARTSSSRLRNKILFNFNNKTILGQVIESVKLAKSIDEIWIATSKNREDDIVEMICKQNSINCFRGSLNDVRSRFGMISTKTNADIIVRVTSDNPFTEPSYIDQMVSYLKLNSNIDYVCMNKSMILDGTGSEVFTSKSLIKSINMSNSKEDLEHVTPFIKNNNQFKIKYLKPADDKYLCEIPYFLGVDVFEDYVRSVNLLSKYSGKDTLKKIIIKLKNYEKIF